MTENIKELAKTTQPGTVLRFQAKPGKGDELFELTNKLHYMKTLADPTQKDPDGPTDWIMCRPDDDSDVLWAMEFYKDDDSMDRHFSDPVIDENHDDIINVMGGAPMRSFVYPVYSNTQKGSFADIELSQPATMLKFQAKPGKGDELFELTNKLHYMKTVANPTQKDPDGPTDWIMCRPKDDPDTLYALEFYKDEASFNRHFEDNTIDENHDHIISLMAGMPMRVNVHKVYAAG